MDADHLAVELVIQTATGLLAGRLGPREAVTILASQVPHARSRAPVVAQHDPEWAATHAELLASIIGELLRPPESRDRRAVASELDRVMQALTVP